MMQKIKLFFKSDKGRDILTILIVILVGLGSFELGRLSKESASSGIKIEYTTQAANFIEASKVSAGASTQTGPKSFFASSRGSKYYPAGCSAGKSIKIENRIYFATAVEAQGAGYELSSSCK